MQFYYISYASHTLVDIKYNWVKQISMMKSKCVYQIQVSVLIYTFSNKYQANTVLFDYRDPLQQLDILAEKFL